jgi:hypothetical protein
MANRVSRLQVVLAELRRRSVFKVASVYAVTAWAASLGAAELLPAFGAPDWSVRVFVLCALLGLPIAVVLAWAYEITPKGILRDATPDTPAPAPPPAAGGAATGNTTVLCGSSGLVRVTWTDGSGRHERSFSGDFRIGRDESCEFHLDDPMISRRHAEIGFADGLWWIRDLGSRNGTMLDGRFVNRAPLPAHCTVKLYEAAPELRFEVKASSRAQTVSAAASRPPVR